MTRGDQIRSMSDEDLAAFLVSVQDARDEKFLKVLKAAGINASWIHTPFITYQLTLAVLKSEAPQD